MHIQWDLGDCDAVWTYFYQTTRRHVSEDGLLRNSVRTSNLAKDASSRVKECKGTLNVPLHTLFALQLHVQK